MINREENLKRMRENYRQKKGSTKQSLESISLPGEIWKSIVVDGKVHSWYSVSTMGRGASHVGKNKTGRKAAGGQAGERAEDPE